MIRELYINDKLVHLSDNALIGITYCANNIGELQNRNSTFSNTIKVPITQHNKVILDWANLVNSASILPYRKLKATYIENGVEIVSNGTGVITSVDDNFFNINIVSGNFDLSELLGDVSVGELYGDEFIYWNKDTITSSNYGQKPHIFPIIDWNSDSNEFFTKSLEIKCDFLPPALIVKDIFKKIENYVKFSFTGSYIQSNDHAKMIVTPDYFEVENPETITGSNTSNKLIFKDVFIDEGDSDDLPIETQIYPRLESFSTDEMSYTGVRAIFSPSELKYGVLKFTGSLAITWKPKSYYDWGQTKQSKNLTIQVELLDNTNKQLFSYVPLNENVKIVDEGGGTEQYKTDIVLDLESSADYLFEPEKAYYFRVTIKNAPHTNIDTRMYATLSDMKYTFTESKSIVYGRKIKYKDVFRMKAKDLLKDILNLRGLIIQTNSYLRTIQINSFDDLRKNKSVAYQWSDKVNSIRSLRYTFGNYAQKNYLKFKEISSVEKGYGDSYFSIDNTNLDIEKTAVQIAHPATHQKTKIQGINVPKISGLNTKKEWQKPQYRILTLDSSFKVVKYIDKTGTTQINSIIPFCKFIPLSEILPVHYKDLQVILDNTKAITAVLKLNGKDINELDFSIPCYLDVPALSISNYFYINRINDYKKGLTNVELVRL